MLSTCPFFATVNNHDRHSFTTYNQLILYVGATPRRAHCCRLAQQFASPEVAECAISIAMGIRSLLSFGLIAVPIGATLGILLGLDQHRKATGQAPLFQDNSVVTKQYCQKAYGISPTSNGQQYTCKSPPVKICSLRCFRCTRPGCATPGYHNLCWATSALRT